MYTRGSTPVAMPLAAHPSSALHPRRLARTALLVLGGGLGVAVLSFLAVLHFQPTTPPAGPTGTNPALTLPSLTDPRLVNGFGEGSDAWLVNYENGHVASRFQAKAYTPQPDGTLNVTKPVADFFLAHGEVMRVTGDTGEVSLGPPAAGGGMPRSLHAPDNGILHHVHITRHPDGNPLGRPTLTVDTDNVRFDNQTLRMFTERTTDADGHDLAADRVPVVLRGDDYDMDGTGLTLRWDGRHRLHLLEIAHGHRLTVRHPNALHVGTPPPPKGTTTVPAATPLTGVADHPVELAAAVAPATVAAAVPAKPAAPLPTPPAPPYRAVFNDDVVVKQLDQTLATGDVLTLDFLQGKPATTKSATTTTTPAEAPGAPRVSEGPKEPRTEGTPEVSGPRQTPLTPGVPSVRGSPVPGSRTASTPPPSTASTRPKPGSEPITIYWTGKLRVTPLEASPPMMPLAAGQAAVRLAGRPATLAYNGGTAAAAVATYRTGDGAVVLAPSADHRDVTLAQKATTLVARGVDFDPATSVATLAGPARLTVAGKPGRPPLVVTWADRGLLHVATDGTALTGVDHVDLAGDVRADDPAAFSLVGRRLLLDFDLAPAKHAGAGEPPQEQLRQMTAAGGAIVRTVGVGQPDRGVQGDRLVVGLVPDATGQPSPRSVVADGHVRVSDADQALAARHLEATLAPKAKPTSRHATTGPTTNPGESVELATLLATGDVRAVLKDGSAAEADALREVTAPDGRQLVELSGARPAVVTSGKGDRFVGSILRLAVRPAGDGRGTADPAAVAAVTVDGPGTLHPAPKPATRPTDPPPKQVDVSWTDALSFDAAANAVDVLGHVIARTTEANGTVTTATGDVAHLDLADPPKTTRPTTTDAGNLGDKQLKALTLAGHMHAKSELDVGPIVVRHGELFGDRLVYDAVAGTATVPGPGRMLVENHRPPTPAVVKPGDKPAPGGNRGTMAMDWQGGMVYRQATDQITITRDARVGFLQDADRPTPNAAAAAAPMQLRSDTLVITMAKAADPKLPVPKGQVRRPSAGVARAGRRPRPLPGPRHRRRLPLGRLRPGHRPAGRPRLPGRARPGRRRHRPRHRLGRRGVRHPHVRHRQAGDRRRHRRRRGRSDGEWSREHRTSNIERRTSNVEKERTGCAGARHRRRPSNTPPPTSVFDVRRSMLDVRCSHGPAGNPEPPRPTPGGRRVSFPTRMPRPRPTTRRAGHAIWAVLVFLVLFTILVVLVSHVYLLPALEAYQHATREQRRQMSVPALLLLSVLLTVLFSGLLLTFRIGRFFFPRTASKPTPTKYVDAWAEAGRRAELETEMHYEDGDDDSADGSGDTPYRP